MEPVLLWYANRCVRCGRCGTSCPLDALHFTGAAVELNRSLCKKCASCVASCPAKALEMSGQVMSADQLIEAALRDRPFYENAGGGVTLSGGEPMMQYAFLTEFLPMLKAQGVHIALDTAAHQPFERYRALMNWVDLFLVDYKHPDEREHRRWTGVSNARIRENLRAFLAQGASIWVRVPVIPGVNDEIGVQRAIAADLRAMNFTGRVELLPFHRLGASKYEGLDWEYAFYDAQPPDDAAMAAYRAEFAAMGLNIQKDQE